MVDDELNRVWLKFPAGARIVTISDSCNSGTVYKLVRNGGGFKAVSSMRPIHPIDKKAGDKMKAQLIHLGGCKDGGKSTGLDNGGVFTLALKETWNKGQFSGGYEKFHEEIKKLVKSESNQEVQMARYGVVTTDFLNQKPFTV